MPGCLHWTAKTNIGFDGFRQVCYLLGTFG